MREAGRLRPNGPDSYSAAQKNLGVDFWETTMVGRQTVHMPPTDVASILGAIGTPREQTSAVVEANLQKRFWSNSVPYKSHGWMLLTASRRPRRLLIRNLPKATGRCSLPQEMSASARAPMISDKLADGMRGNER
jgi:hypothetical protein